MMEGVDETTFADNRSMDSDAFEDGKRHWLFYLIQISNPITIFSGVLLNILAFVILVRCRLWLKHEGYVYLATILITNVGVLLFTTSSFYLPFAYLPATMCRLLSCMKSIFFVSGWLAVALLLTCYLRTRPTRSGERCSGFAAKYCTLFASKVVVGVVIGSLLLTKLPYVVLFDWNDCVERRSVAMVVSMLIQPILMFLVPFVVLIVILLLIRCSASKKDNVDPGSAQNTEEVMADNEMRKMAITISLLILLMQFAVIFVRAVFDGVKGYPPIIELVHSLTLSIHPVLCFRILAMFRQGVRSQLRSNRCCHRLCPSLDRKEGEENAPMTATLQEAPK